MSLAELYARHRVVLAPMEDVTDAAYRRLCRGVGATVCMTEFVRAEHMISMSSIARRKIALAPDDTPTGIQIYGADAELLMQAAECAAEARPAFIDVNCGCWVPRVAKKGAGAAWLRDPDAMVAMAAQVVRAVDLPVSVKTRIGWGPESHMPIVELARRLEDVGVAALTIHCRTAQQGHDGAAEWSWARRAQEVVRIPVVVNGDVRSAADVVRALAETGCAAVMIGRQAIEYPWIFREADALLDGRPPLAPPDDEERLAFYAAMVEANCLQRGEKHGVEVSRRHFRVLGPRLLAERRAELCVARTRAATLNVLRSGAEGAAPRRAS